MKICSQCASPTNEPEKVNDNIVCQECADKFKGKMKTIFIVCIEEKFKGDDFLFACKTRKIAEEKAAEYEKEYNASMNGWECIIFEEELI